MHMVECPRYDDDSSESLRGDIFREKRILTRTQPFGVRLQTWYDRDPLLPVDDLLGSRGGSAGFTIIPTALQTDSAGRGVSTRSRIGGTTIQGLGMPKYFVNGGILWIPFAAEVFWSWPDISARNLGTVSYSCETWDAEFQTSGSKGLCFTQYLTDGQSITLDPWVRWAQCSAPFAALELPVGILFQTGNEAVQLGGVRIVTMRFLPGMPGVISRAPVTFYYGF